MPTTNARRMIIAVVSRDIEPARIQAPCTVVKCTPVARRARDRRVFECVGVTSVTVSTIYAVEHTIRRTICFAHTRAYVCMYACMHVCMHRERQAYFLIDAFLCITRRGTRAVHFFCLCVAPAIACTCTAFPRGTSL